MTYHETMIDLIYYILSKGEEYVNFIDSGNAYDKIIRNYHQFNFKGEKVYRNAILMVNHYRISEEAWNKINNFSEIHFEHVYPVKLIKNELRELINTGISKEKIKEILDKTEIVVLSKDQASKLDKQYKDNLPENGKDRISVMKYAIKKSTKDNTLFR